jgi:hypothetical protein
MPNTSTTIIALMDIARANAHPRVTGFFIVIESKSEQQVEERAPTEADAPS